MAKNSKWGNIVFYKTKEGKLRWFDPDKAKTPEGKAKIKAIRMGKGYQGKTTDMDEERVAKAKKALETKKAGAIERKARAAEDALNKQFDKNPTTSKDKNELRRLANEKANAVGDLYYSLSGNKDKVGSPSIRDEKNIRKAKAKAEERAHIKEVKEKAENPNFDAEKYAKYFDKDGKIIPEKFDEWNRKQKGEELNKKSAEAQKAKADKEDRSSWTSQDYRNRHAELEHEAYFKMQDLIYADPENKEAARAAQKEIARKLEEHDAEWERFENKQKADLEEAYKKASKLPDKPSRRKKDGVDKALEEYPKVAAENKKALDDKYGKDPRILARDWAKKVHEGADREDVVREIGSYAKERGLSSKERDDIIADVDKAVSYNKTHSSDPKEIKKANDAFVKKTSVKPAEKTEKIKWNTEPQKYGMGFKEGEYKGMIITQNDGTVMPKGISVNIEGDEVYAKSIADARRIIDEYTAKNAPKGRTGSAPSKAMAKLSPMTPERRAKAKEALKAKKAGANNKEYNLKREEERAINNEARYSSYGSKSYEGIISKADQSRYLKESLVESRKKRTARNELERMNNNGPTERDLLNIKRVKGESRNFQVLKTHDRLEEDRIKKAKKNAKKAFKK